MEEVVSVHRFSARSLTVVALAGLLAAASLPALAKSSRPKQHRGKKAIGEVVSFDAATSALVVDVAGDEDFTGTVSPDVQVKLDHRGWNKKGESHGNPTEGSIEDLLPGTPVLRMKVEEDVVTKIRLRPTGDEAPMPPAEDGEEDEGDALPGDEAPADDVADDDPTDDDPTSDDTAGEHADTNPDDDLGDPEDALPPLPVSQP
jgi:hypothetical protein